MVTAFLDLCLGAPLSDVLLLLPLECVVGDTTKKQEGTACPVGHLPKSDGSLLSRKLSILETHLETFTIRAIRRLSATHCCTQSSTGNT